MSTHSSGQQYIKSGHNGALIQFDGWHNSELNALSGRVIGCAFTVL